MAIGFVVHDLLYLTLIALIYGSAFSFAHAGFSWLVQRVAWFVAAPLAGVLGLVAAITVAGALTALCPRLQPGRYKMMKGKIFFSWMLRALIRRALLFPGIKWVIFSSNVLRFFALRSLGARVAFTSSFSADVDVLDPALLTVEPGAIVGTRCLLAGHFVQGGELLLARVHVGRGALLAGQVIALPGVRIGERALIKGGACISIDVDIGERASIGACSAIDAHAKIGKGARVGNACVIGPRTGIPEGASIAWGTRLGDKSASEPD